MKDGKYQAGVIGLHMGRAHCIGYRDHADCELKAICDVDSAVLERVKGEFSPSVATADYRELINDPELDIISVASPDYFHAEHCISALRAGKHVLCEKPLTLNLEEAKQILAETKVSKGKFMIGQVCRYAPGFVQAKHLVEDGMIGDLFCVESEYAHNYGGSPGAGRWRVDARREPFIGGGCHAVDLLRWIAGDAYEVSAYSNHKCLTDWPVNDCTVAIFKFPNNVIGKVLVSIGCRRPYTMRSVFWGTEGTIVCDNTSPEIQLYSTKMRTTKLAFSTIPVNIANHNVSAEIADFVDCIKNDKPVATSILEGAKTVAAALAAVQSAKEGRPVAIEQMS